MTGSRRADEAAGFTLMELLALLAVLGLPAAVLLPVFAAARAREVDYARPTAPTVRPAHGYRLTALAPPPGYDALYATCLNERGQVAGYVTARKQVSFARPRGARAFLWDGRGMRLLPTRPSSYSGAGEPCDSVASGLNNRGQVVGTLSYAFDGAWMGIDLQAVIWDGRELREIPRLPGMNQNTAIAVNDAGQVAGTADDDFIADADGHPAPHAFLYAAGRSQDLGPGCASGLNARGQVCGYVFLNRQGVPTADNNNVDLIARVQAVLWDPDGRHTTLGGGYALAVNASGSVVGTDEVPVMGSGHPALRTDLADALGAGTVAFSKGFSHDHKTTLIFAPKKTDAARRARTVLWRTGGARSRAVPLPLPAPPQALGDGGATVGGHWLRRGGRTDDLNRLLAAGSGWTIVCATAVNRRGQIAGWGRHRGRVEGFLLTPRR